MIASSWTRISYVEIWGSATDCFMFVYCRGRKKVCLVFFILHLFVGIWKKISVHPGVWVANICLSLASSVFSYNFETWVVVEHEKVCVYNLFCFCFLHFTWILGIYYPFFLLNIFVFKRLVSVSFIHITLLGHYYVTSAHVKKSFMVVHTCFLFAARAQARFFEWHLLVNEFLWVCIPNWKSNTHELVGGE